MAKKNEMVTSMRELTGLAAHALAEHGKGSNSALADFVSSAVAGNDELVQMDGILSAYTATENTPAIKLNDLIFDSVSSSIAEGIEVTPDALLSALTVANKAAGSMINMDGINSLQAGEVAASLVALNIQSILSANISGISGNVSEMSRIDQGSGGASKFQVISVTPVASGGMGSIGDGEAITPINAGSPMACTERTATQPFVATVLTHTFIAEAIGGDGGYPLERGLNEIIVNGIELSDYDISTQESTGVRTVVSDGITYTATFYYDQTGVNTGKATLGLSGNIAVGTKVYFSLGLSSKNKAGITGTVAVDLKPSVYVAHPVLLNVSVDSLSARRVSANGKVDLMSLGYKTALNKISSEIKANSLRKAVVYAKDIAGVVDLSTASFNTPAENYRPFSIAIGVASFDIVKDSSLTSSINVFGGSGLVKVFKGLEGITDGSAAGRTSDENGIRFLGMMNNEYPCYFDPRHDIDYPVVNGEHKAIIIGTPAEASKRVVIFGIGLPILPAGKAFSATGEETIPLQGEIVNSPNKDKNSRKLARILTFKV